MKCNNKDIIKIIPVLYFLIIASIVALNFIGFNNLNLNPQYPNWLFALESLLLLFLFIYIYRNAQYFEFDGSGEVLVFVNEGTLLSNFFSYRLHRAEFPKSRLKYFEIKDYFVYKKLIVYINSRQQRTKKLYFNITFLNYKKQKLVLKTLSEISDINKGTINGYRKLQ